MLLALATVSGLIHGALAQSTVAISTGVPSITLSTAIASATAPASTPLPSEVALPPKQAWCPSDIFCAGPLLQAVAVANLFPDDKTFVDKPTSKSSQAVLADFNNITLQNATFGELFSFVDSDFAGEGLELEALPLANFNPSPPFLKNVTDPLLKAFSQTVHGFWTQLVRGTNASTLCGSSGKCESTLIPLNHTFVVPGGRFRELYYWDSFWIVEGLIQSGLLDIANGTLQNFMDEIDDFGFIPNGGRIYYLARSQPPLFVHMLSQYVAAGGDKAILTRALPLAEKELKWWDDNRSVNVTSPFTNASHIMHRYIVNNTAPRPESYLADYMTANTPDANGATLNATQRADLYAELASGAETGWDYTARWFINPNATNGLQSLNVRSTIPIDLNSILYKSHLLIAQLYGSSNASAVTRHQASAASLKAGILDLFWDSQKLAFYDYNLATGARGTVFSAAHFYPFWSGIIPNDIQTSEQNAFGAFASVNMVLHRYNGTFPSTFLQTGLQWDAPNTWPPHQYIALQALAAIPANLTTGPVPTTSSNQSTFDLIPSGQLVIAESQLPGQPVRLGSSPNATLTGPGADVNTLNGTVVNGGNATQGENWAQTLQRELANRYFASALCSWQATGGSIPGILPRLSDPELNVTLSTSNDGNMFEKFSVFDIDSAGSGGEYTVQAGFGWTNGVVLWMASNYGNVLVAPTCPNLLTNPTGSSQSGSGGSGGGSGSKGNSAASISERVSLWVSGMLATVTLFCLL